MTFFDLLRKALAARRPSVALSVMATSLVVLLLVLVLGLRRDALHRLDAMHRAPPLVVGGGASPSGLVLATVLFVDEPIGLAPAGLLEELRDHPSTRSVLPMSLGDSFRGHPIVATSGDVFAAALGLVPEGAIARGRAFDDLAPEAVVGAEVARALDVRVGDRIEPSHGGDDAAGHGAEYLFEVVGVLAATRTPLDDVVLVPRRAFDTLPGHVEAGRVSAILVVPKAGMHLPMLRSELAKRSDVVVAETQRELARLRERFGAVDRVLGVVCALSLVVAWLGLLASSWLVARTRLREMALLRHVGAGPGYVAGLLVAESTLVAFVGGLLGLGGGLLGVALGGSSLHAYTGLAPEAQVTVEELAVLLLVGVGGGLAGLLPAVEVHRRDLFALLRGYA